MHILKYIHACNMFVRLHDFRWMRLIHKKQVWMDIFLKFITYKFLFKRGIQAVTTVHRHQQPF